jgi:hypothetical protein
MQFKQWDIFGPYVKNSGQLRILKNIYCQKRHSNLSAPIDFARGMDFEMKVVALVTKRH